MNKTKKSINQGPREALAIYTLDCLKCSHLVDGAKKAYVKCHFTKGNEECPAQEVKIVPVGQAARYAHNVIEARSKRDLKRESALLNKVSLKSKEFQARFFDLLQNLTNP